MGNVQSSNRQRLPPSASTYAQYIYANQPHRIPDSGALLDHRQHIHFGPSDGVFDCNRRSDRIEDRYGHCFFIRDPPLRDQPFVAWGGDSGQMISWGDMVGIGFVLAAVTLVWCVANMSSWVMEVGKELLTYEEVEEEEVIKPARPALAVQPGLPKKMTSQERIWTRRNGFSHSDNLLRFEEREDLRTASRERRREVEGQEVYKDGEYSYRFDDSPYESEDEEGNEMVQVELGRCDLAVEENTEPQGWMPGCQGDLLFVRV